MRTIYLLHALWFHHQLFTWDSFWKKDLQHTPLMQKRVYQLLLLILHLLINVFAIEYLKVHRKKVYGVQKMGVFSAQFFVPSAVIPTICSEFRSWQPILQMLSYLTRWILQLISDNLISLVLKSKVWLYFFYPYLLFQLVQFQLSILLFAVFLIVAFTNIFTTDIVFLWFFGSEIPRRSRKKCFRGSGKIKSYC